MIQKLSYLDWNKIKNKNDEVDVVLKPCDIVYKINSLYCACETTNECNNILVFSNEYNIKNITSMLMFIYILGKYEDIKYITITSSINRYNLFKKIFNRYGAFPKSKNNMDEFYFKIDDEGLIFLYNFIIKNSHPTIESGRK